MTEPQPSEPPIEASDTTPPLASHHLPVDEHFEEVSENGKRIRRKGVYLLPNLITTAALFSGFYAILSGVNGHFEHAAIAIIVALFLDGFDGRVARLTNTTSAFGVQYDSLSDMVSFGVAPAVVMFAWGLEPLGKLGWAAAFMYAACAALRLARFNTQVDVVDKRYFVGLPSPAAAILIASIIWFSGDKPSTQLFSFIAAVTTILSGLLMVSNIRYSSFKGLGLKGRVPFIVMLTVVLACAVISINPALGFLGIALTYAASGPVFWVKNRTKHAEDEH
ncbi:MAG: hypothetical protein RL497_3037 [Pseudomonadota bacterium]|jgi:CDP-diacylglycerol--serine O-phosphatidyltransferase